MFSIVDNLIFPAPQPSYSRASHAGRLIYVPKRKLQDMAGTATVSPALTEESPRKVAGMTGKSKTMAFATDELKMIKVPSTRALVKSPITLQAREDHRSPSAASSGSIESNKQRSQVNVTTPTRRTIFSGGLERRQMQQQQTVRQDLLAPNESAVPLATSFLYPDDGDTEEYGPMGARDAASRANLRSENSIQERGANGPKKGQARPVSPAGPSKPKHNNFFPQTKVNTAVYSAYNGNEGGPLAQDSVDTIEAPFRPERAISNPRPAFTEAPLSVTPKSGIAAVKSASKLPLSNSTVVNPLGLQQFKKNIATLRNIKKYQSNRDGRNNQGVSIPRGDFGRSGFDESEAEKMGISHVKALSMSSPDPLLIAGMSKGPSVTASSDIHAGLFRRGGGKPGDLARQGYAADKAERAKRPMKERPGNGEKVEFKNATDLDSEVKRLQQMSQRLQIAGEDDYIPCLYYQGRNDKVMIHFHANGEDIGLTSPLMNKIVERIGVSIICVEYPGYGVYRGAADGRARQILEDARSVYLFIRDVCKVPEDCIIICGRSIGSGPACHLASTFDALALMLISPIKSVVDVARQKYGRIVDFLIEERFDNIGCARHIKCPTVIFHGIADSMVPHQSSIEMLMHGFKNCEACLFLREDMEHNKFNYTADIIEPLRYFLKINRISTKNKVSQMSPRKLEELRQRGYIDWADALLFQGGKEHSKSQYWTNFNEKFKAIEPKLGPDGQYLPMDFSRNINDLDRTALANEVMSAGEMSSALEGEEYQDILSPNIIAPLDVSRPSLFAKDNYATQNKISQPIKSKRSARSNAPTARDRFSEISESAPMKDLPLRSRILPKSSKEEPAPNPVMEKQTVRPMSPLEQAAQQKANPLPTNDSCRVDTNEEDIADSNGSRVSSRMMLKSPEPAEAQAEENIDDLENIKESIIVPDDTLREAHNPREPRLSEMNLKLKMNNPHSTKTNQRRIDLSSYFRDKSENPYSPRGQINKSPFCGSPGREARFKQTTPQQMPKKASEMESNMGSTARIEDCGLSPKLGQMPLRFQPFQHTKKYFRKATVNAFTVGQQYFAPPEEQIKEASSRVQSRLEAASKELSVRTDLDRRRKTQQVQSQGLRNGTRGLNLLEIKRQSQKIARPRDQLGAAKVLSIKLTSMEQVQKPAAMHSVEQHQQENIESLPDLGSTERQHKDLPRLTFGHDIGIGLIDSVANEDGDSYSILLPHETRSPADASHGGLLKSRHRSTKANIQPTLSSKHSKKLLAGTMDMRRHISPFRDAYKEDTISKLKEANRVRRQTQKNLLSQTVDDNIKQVSLKVDIPDDPYQPIVAPSGSRLRNNKHPYNSINGRNQAASSSFGHGSPRKYESKQKPVTTKPSGEKSRVGKIYYGEKGLQMNKMSVSGMMEKEKTRKVPNTKAKLLFRKPNVQYSNYQKQNIDKQFGSIAQESKINELSKISSQSGLAERRRSTLRSEVSAPTAIKAPMKSKPAHPSASKKWRNGNYSVQQILKTHDSMRQMKHPGHPNASSMRYWHGQQTKPPQYAHATMKKKSPGKAKKSVKPKRVAPKPSSENILDSIRNSGDSGANVRDGGSSESVPVEAEDVPSAVHASQPIMIQNSVLHNAVITINIHQPQQPEKNMSEQELARMIERNRKKVKAYLQNN